MLRNSFKKVLIKGDPVLVAMKCLKINLLENPLFHFPHPIYIAIDVVRKTRYSEILAGLHCEHAPLTLLLILL